MKKSILGVVLGLTILCQLITTERSYGANITPTKGLTELVELPTYDDTVIYHEPQLMRATCYTWTGNPTRSGVYPRQGITVAGKYEWLGYTCVLYTVKEDGSIGDFIGFYEFEDTGYGMNTPQGGTIELGQSIDIYRDTLDGCYEWVREYGDYLYVQVIPSEG